MKKIVAVFALAAILLPQLSMAAALPSDLRIKYSTYGGIYPESSEVEITKDGGKYKHIYDGSVQIVEFPVSSKELNSLYSSFRLYFFNSIKIRKQEVYNRGGDSISLSFDGKNTTKDNYSQSFLNGSVSRWRYERIAGNIKTLVKKKIAPYYHNLAIEVESDMTPYTVELAVNGQRLSNLHKALMLPGVNQLSVILYDGKKVVRGEAFEIEIPEVSIARIQIRDQYISLSTE